MAVISKDSVVMRLARNAKTYDIEFEKRNAILEEKEKIVDLNRSQLRKGVNAEGEFFGAYKSLAYAEFKESLSSYKAKFHTPDLYLTGSLQDKMDLRIDGDVVVIFSHDPEATKKLVGRFFSSYSFGFPRSPRFKVKKLAISIVTKAFIKNSKQVLFD